MKQILIKAVTEEGSAYYNKTRLLNAYPVQEFPGRYVFKEHSGNVVEPTDLELELYNESQSGGIKVTNGWITFIGILTLINVIFVLTIISKFIR